MAKKIVEKKTTHQLQDEHLMGVMENMVQTLGVRTTSHSNTIKVVGDGVGDVLQALVEQVPVLDMKVYKVGPQNSGVPVDVHVIHFTSNLLEHGHRMRLGRVMGLKV